jgi:hypothetical protein
VSGNLARFQRDGQRREEWYAPKIILNLSDISSTVGPLNVANVSASNTLAIDNPAFAIYPGKLWVPNASSYRLRRGEGDTRSLKFHKKADCDFRFLGGAKKWGSCTTRLQTGKGNLNDVQRVAEWRGNGTLITGDDFVQTIPRLFILAGLMRSLYLGGYNQHIRWDADPPNTPFWVGGLPSLQLHISATGQGLRLSRC